MNSKNNTTIQFSKRDNSYDDLDALFSSHMENPQWNKIRSSCPEHFIETQLTAHEAAILSVMLRISKGKSILEIGTGYGFSTIWLAANMPKDAKLITIERDSERHELAQNNFATSGIKSDNVTFMLGEAIDIINNQLNDHLFDFIFIDANKAMYLQYFKVLDNLLTPGGVIIFDDALLYQNNIDSRSQSLASKIAKMRNYALSHPNYHGFLLHIYHGFLILSKNQDIEIA